MDRRAHSWYVEKLQRGQLVHVPETFTFSVDSDKYHEVLIEVSVSWDFEKSFFVKQGTPGIYIRSSNHEDCSWSLVLFPQGVGWVDSSWLKVIK